MEKWAPIEKDEFEALLAQEIAEFEPDDEQLWFKYQVPLRTAPIVRSEAYGREQVFVVAEIADRILFFDDVEDEFGVARLPSSGPIEDYGTYGELRFALRGLARYA